MSEGQVQVSGSTHYCCDCAGYVPDGRKCSTYRHVVTGVAMDALEMRMSARLCGHKGEKFVAKAEAPTGDCVGLLGLEHDQPCGRCGRTDCVQGATESEELPGCPLCQGATGPRNDGNGVKCVEPGNCWWGWRGETAACGKEVKKGSPHCAVDGCDKHLEEVRMTAGPSLRLRCPVHGIGVAQ